MNNRRLLVRDQRQTALDRYQQALTSLSNAQPETWLPVLFARDYVLEVRKQSLSFSDQQAQKLVELDYKLRQEATEEMLSALPSWRKSFEPPQNSWWWYLDQAVSKTKALNRYQEALNDLKKEEPQTLLPLLLARDHVEKLLRSDDGLSLSFSDGQTKELLELDQQLRQKVTGPLLEKFETLRMTCRPTESHWWWFLDLAAVKRDATAAKREAEKREAEKREAEKREAEKELIWELLTGSLLVLILPLTLDIIQRLWDGAPDALSIIGTLITLLLTASPLTKRGREVASLLMARIPRFPARFPARFHSATMTGMASVAFVLLLGIRVLGLPSLALYYNYQGLAAIDRHPTEARQYFQRAVALDADMAVGYYHLGIVYEEIGQPKEAISWYQQTIEHDLNLGEAVSSLGRLYILQGDSQQALQVLHAGLLHAKSQRTYQPLIRYKLLSNLGWAYFEQEQPKLAREVLEEALALESQLDVNHRSAVVHYHLALLYEEQPDKALSQWEDSLRYIEKSKPEQWEWEQTILEHLEKLRKEMP